MSVENLKETEFKKVDTETVKCSGCGANMKYDPDTFTLYCEHCGAHQDLGELRTAHEISLVQGLDSERMGAGWDEQENTVFTCDNCGAQVVLTANESASECPFCGTAHVTESKYISGLKPNAVIPFTFGVEKAIDYAKAWAKKKLYAPKKFKKKLSADGVKGVYVPAFTFDSFTSTSYFGRVGTRHTRTVGVGSNRRVETYIVWRNITGTYNRNFNDVLITAGSKFGQAQLNKVSPYQTDNSIVYEEKYLLGFMAYKYDLAIEDCWAQAQTSMHSAIRAEILRNHPHDVVDYLNINVSHNSVSYKYVMLPVYVGNFTYHKKLYNFFVNGSTGRVAGKTPKSALKIIVTILIAIGLGVLAYFLATLL